ncbi:hypothetical protein M3P21_18965 [Ruegeria sp. 2012CJ41-6]|uniref:Uncharacterized protein n=1 Tax=Ruegeria spongiae TaxID=2942209 RepID=A0ABT0Q720_9RHOB|nr:hypothetical protein [Ruegeria spongiae]MCL6285615.1 hypothetical protein [Ruegeria spongiae]
MYLNISRGVVGSSFVEKLDLPNLVLNQRQSSAPGMLSYMERAMLSAVAGKLYRGVGVIIDGGSFFGSSLVASASGLQSNPSFADMDFSNFPDGKPLHGYELGYLPPPASEKVDRNRVFNGTPYTLGESFVPILEENVAPYKGLISLHIGDLNEEKWDGTPIEIAFVDVCKSIRLNAHVSKQFYPSMIGGNSVLINQDFFFDRLPWIKVTMGYLKDYYRWEGQVFTSSIYTSIKDLPQDVADYDPFTQGSYEECMTYHDATGFPGIDRKYEFFLELSRGYLMALKGRKTDALDYLRAVADGYQDLMADEHTDRGNQFRMDRAVRQITNGNLFKVS